ncbi:hypothetical protein KC343_g1320 [Hortaea werneckii]|uniref:Uncharacterized protein n=1 Tax=Hortaea werneckii TaxID=91943 RepID=A0A3M7FFA4_HORWE|nr:hypothetical protein KC352_g13925 [Hortaea werneckii]KAI7570912.1 hypothetical protein KC317_g2069 [Hortaea werneckii]KAI7616137.1 hypothetical protein KC346_g6152 [Hortaea werneckii]KAI7636384.1 hypothetical protein KC343_g1320 [Hortaea werneckii]KAI7668259.1 hypothetical protein KC319_g6451 [Hortaea werneckii]
MALKSVDSCTVLNNSALSLGNCSPDLASNLDQYPSYADCDEELQNATRLPEVEDLSFFDRKYCYAIANQPPGATNGTDGPFGPLIQALTDCSSDGVPRGGYPCVNFVAVQNDTDIEQFVSCLADHDAAPTFNSTGLILDAYCVPSAEAQRNGEEVQVARQNSTASSTTASSSTGTATGMAATGSETSGAYPNAGTGWFKLGLLGLGLWAAVGVQ